ncbi:MAG: MltA domain-containing protein, partial [Phycisphaerae bacterium]|nr:MltA domain-containing protein [Phycisphaerae bacterium]
MERFRLAVWGIGLSAALLTVGCKTARELEAPQYDRPLPPGQYALRKITDPAMIPDITLACYDTTDLRKAIDHSLSYLSKPSSKRYYPMGEITHEMAMSSVRAMAELLDGGMTGRNLQKAILDRFDFYQSVGCDDRGTVLFTGYYTPIFEGSLKADSRFRYPLYKQPDDLVKGPNGEVLGRKLPNGSIVQYPSRREIEQTGMLRGQEIAWLADPFEVYIAHVQGSAIVRLPDGKQVTLGYAANNGHEYNSVAQEMIRDGLVPASGMSLKAMIDYFKAHPDQIEKYVYRNPRYVFFRLDEGNPRGSLNEPVTPLRTIATDKSIYPRACLAFLKTVLPRPTGSRIVKAPYTGFALDQDT